MATENGRRNNPRTLEAGEILGRFTDPYQRFSSENFGGMSDGEVRDFVRFYDEVTRQLGYRPVSGTVTGLDSMVGRPVMIYVHSEVEGYLEKRQVTLEMPGDRNGRPDRVWTFGNGVHVYERRSNGSFGELAVYRGGSAEMIMRNVLTHMQFSPHSSGSNPSLS